MTTPEWRSRYELAQELARRAGELANSYFRGSYEVIIKDDQSPVTVADRAAEELIRSEIQRLFPGDGFLGEEFGDQPGSSGFRWVIDPIDGTKSFIRGIPLWGTLIGLEHHGEPIAGACYVPGWKQLFHALRGQGAYRDDCRIQVSEIANLSSAMLCYSSISWFQDHHRQEQFLKLVEGTDRQRGYGDFIGFLLVAQGSSEIMVDHGVHPWDIAALLPIVEEAGGRLTDWQGTRTIHRPDVLASNGRLHGVVQAILNE